jgi:hypothetical protein
MSVCKRCEGGFYSDGRCNVCGHTPKTRKPKAESKRTYFVTIALWVEADSQEKAEKDAAYIVHEITSTRRVTIEVTSASVDNVQPADEV